jgi:hypothetical protein
VKTVSKKNKTKGKLEEEIDLLDTMLSSLVDILEQKGILTHAEWERHIKERVKVE